MKACQNCGQPLDESELFCGSCGSKFEEVPASSEGAAGAFCPNCGEKLEPGTVFCPICGANTQTGTPPANTPGVSHTTKPKKPMSHRMVGIVAIAAVVVATISVIAVASNLLKSPADTFVANQREFLMTEGVDRLIEVSDLYNSYAQMSTDMVIRMEVDDDMVMEYLEDSSLSLKLNMGKQSILANAELSLMGSPVLKGAFTYDAGTLGFCLPEADPTYYKIDLNTLAENYGGMSGIDLNKLEIPEIPSSTLSKLGRIYMNVVLGAVNKDNVTLSDRDKIRLESLGKSVEGKLYIFEPTAEDLEKMFLKLADTIESDKELRGFVTTFLGSNKEFCEEVLYLRDIDLALLDAAEYLQDNAEDMARAMERAGFTWSMGISDGQVCLQKISTENGEQSFGYEAMGEESKERREAVYFSSYGSVQWGTETTSTKSGGTYSGKMVMTQYGSTMLAVRFKDVDKDKKSILGMPHGTYDFILDNYYYSDMALSMTVSAAKGGGTDHVCRVEGIDDYTLGDWVEVSIYTSDKKSTAAKPSGKAEDISDYDYGEFYDLFNDLSSSLYRQMNDLLVV